MRNWWPSLLLLVWFVVACSSQPNDPVIEPRLAALSPTLGPGNHSPFHAWPADTALLNSQETAINASVDYVLSILDNMGTSRIGASKKIAATTRTTFEFNYHAANPASLPPAKGAHSPFRAWDTVGNPVWVTQESFRLACVDYAYGVIDSIASTKVAARRALVPPAGQAFEEAYNAPAGVLLSDAEYAYAIQAETLFEALETARAGQPIPGSNAWQALWNLQAQWEATIRARATSDGVQAPSPMPLLTVNPNPGPVLNPIVTLTALPSAIFVGSSTTLTWMCKDVDSVSIDHGIGAVPLNGSRSVTPGTTTTYVISGLCNQGTVTGSYTVTVSPLPTSTDPWPPVYPTGFNPIGQPEQPIPAGALVLVPGTNVPTRSANGTALGLANPASVPVDGHAFLPWDGTTLTSAGFKYGTSGWKFNLYVGTTTYAEPEHVEFSLDGGAWQATRTQDAYLPLGMADGVHQVRIVSWPKTGNSFPWQPIYVKRLTTATGVTWALYQ